MAQLVRVSRTEHGEKVWRRPDNYSFAASQALVPIAAGELAPVASMMPLAFVQHEGRYVAMGLASPVPDHNFFVAPTGQWLVRYVPALVRAYPFTLDRVEGSDQGVLCVDADSGLIADEEGFDFFAENGSIDPRLQQILDFLARIEAGRTQLDLALATLDDFGIIEAWPMNVRTDQGEQPVAGLFRINEQALNGIDTEQFVRLRKASALPVAYAQSLSMNHVGSFDQLIKLHQRLTASKPELKPEDLFPSAEDDIIRFD